MSSAELRLSYRPDDEWLGQLDAVVVSGVFSGRGLAWFDRQSLKEKFVGELRAFPLDQNNPPMIESGFWSKENPGTLKQCHLRIAIRPHDVRGTLLVQIDLATESWGSPDIDQQQTVTARFVTEYALLDRFASQLAEVLDGNRETAVLSGTAS
jgi:hypothetical protein